MEIKLKPTLKLVLKELGIAAVLATVSWLFLAGNFGTVFVLTLLIRYYMKNKFRGEGHSCETDPSRDRSRGQGLITHNFQI